MKIGFVIMTESNATRVPLELVIDFDGIFRNSQSLTLRLQSVLATGSVRALK